MSGATKNQYSASEQGLGYIYQARFALLKLMQLPEETSLLIEKDDDLDFVNESGTKTLASLKHKATGDRLTDLSLDFWKSLRIWLSRYIRDQRSQSNLRFFLFTTAEVPPTSFLRHFLPDAAALEDGETISKIAEDVLAKSASEQINTIAEELRALSEEEKKDFLSRILIFHQGVRITDIPKIIQDQHMRTTRRDFRAAVYERLEGWWDNTVINLMSGTRTEAVYGYEVSDKLSAFGEEYKSDNLPITFRGKEPTEEIDTDSDPRLFVAQLREIGVSSSRIRNAILDYYRAFEQRSAWARENLLVAGEIEDYEDRLVDEWSRYKDVIFEALVDESPEQAILDAGKTLYQWADLESGRISALRIRERVTEPYVIRGGLHILANREPVPRVYWHPHFISRLGELLGVAA
jgi:hypothetical protein